MLLTKKYICKIKFWMISFIEWVCEFLQVRYGSPSSSSTFWLWSTVGELVILDITITHGGIQEVDFLVEFAGTLIKYQDGWIATMNQRGFIEILLRPLVVLIMTTHEDLLEYFILVGVLHLTHWGLNVASNWSMVGYLEWSLQFIIEEWREEVDALATEHYPVSPLWMKLTLIFIPWWNSLLLRGVECIRTNIILVCG